MLLPRRFGTILGHDLSAKPIWRRGGNPMELAQWLWLQKVNRHIHHRHRGAPGHPDEPPPMCVGAIGLWRGSDHDPLEPSGRLLLREKNKGHAALRAAGW